MLHRLALALCAAALASAIVAPTAAATHAWGSYHWARTANPFTLQVGDNVDSTWDSHLDAAISDWHASSVLNLVEVAGQSTKRCAPTSGRIEVCNGTYGQNGWLGLAQIWASGSHITQATTKVNDTYFNTATYNHPTKRQHVMCQEIGHDFGLGHQDESGADLNTCMDYSKALDNPDPNQHDYSMLETIYAHLDSTTTVGAAAAPGNSPVVHTERRDTITHSTIEEHMQNGVVRVTHVTWAIEEHHDHS